LTENRPYLTHHITDCDQIGISQSHVVLRMLGLQW